MHFVKSIDIFTEGCIVGNLGGGRNCGFNHDAILCSLLI